MRNEKIEECESVRIDLQHTWIDRFIHNGNIGIAHKIWGDNMWLLYPNLQVARVLEKSWVWQSYSVSAFRNSSLDFNTSSKLIDAWESQNKSKIMEVMSEIDDFHSNLLEQILAESPAYERNELIKYSQKLFQEYKKSLNVFSSQYCDQAHDYMTWVSNRCFSLLSVGEIIAAKVFVKYLKNHRINAQYIDTTQLQNIGRWNLTSSVETFLRNKFAEIYTTDASAIPVIPWYIWLIEWGILSTLGRGYTDFTASRSAVAMHDSGNYDQVLLYIQKLYGFKSTDPRILWETDGDAVSVNHLSYELTQRAIGRRWAWAWLINPYSLDEWIQKRLISILVWNPTNDSDKARIDKDWNLMSTGVELVLWRDYNGWFDDWVYGRQSQDTHWNHNVYLMWENISQLWEIYKSSMALLKNKGITESGWQIKMWAKWEISLVFKDKETAQAAQRLLHRHFIA